METKLKEATGVEKVTVAKRGRELKSIEQSNLGGRTSTHMQLAGRTALIMKEGVAAARSVRIGPQETSACLESLVLYQLKASS